jgi:hypothetical protein
VSHTETKTNTEHRWWGCAQNPASNLGMTEAGSTIPVSSRESLSTVATRQSTVMHDH